MICIILNIHYKGFPGRLVVKNPPVNVRDVDSSPGWVRGNGEPFKYSCL